MQLVIAIIAVVLLLGGGCCTFNPMLPGDRVIGVTSILAGAATMWLAFHL